MGLDIYLALGLTQIPPEQLDEDYEPRSKKIRDWVRLYENPAFPGRADGIEPGTYTYREHSSVFSMSYGRYNQWRERLAQCAGYPLTAYETRYSSGRAHAAACWDGATGPFSELIDFSDCEGYLGPIVCRKLAEDFANVPRGMENDADYAKLAQAFRLAADECGAVVFG